MNLTLSAIVVTEEAPSDAASREALLDRAMGPDRLLKPSQRLREGRLPAIALSAHAGGRLVGSVRLWHVDAGGRPALLLGPLAVEPEAQGTGIGSRLMRAALNRAAVEGHSAVILVGDAAYYQRFGFRPEPTRTLLMPGPVDRTRFLALELREGALAGAAGLLVATGEPEVKLLPPAVVSREVMQAVAA